MSAKWPLSMSSTAPIVRTVRVREGERGGSVCAKCMCVVDIVTAVVVVVFVAVD